MRSHFPIVSFAAGALQDIQDDYDRDVKAGKRKPGVYDVRKDLAAAFAFPVDSDPSAEARETCKRMRAEGADYKTIMAATGLVRTTVWRYLTDAQR